MLIDLNNNIRKYVNTFNNYFVTAGEYNIAKHIQGDIIDR